MPILKNARPALTVSLLAVSSAVFAHPGHDHGHWSSPAIHALLFAAVTTAAVSAFLAFRSRSQKRRPKADK